RPWRGGKGFPYEGGVRVPLIVTAPGVTKSGLVTDTPVIHTDFLPTLLALAGGKQPSAVYDGTDITRVLRGETLPARDLGWHFPHYWGGDLITPYSSLRSGDWKIVRWYEYETEELYNLVADPSENSDLAKRYPQKLVEMHGKLDAWLKSNDAQPPSLKKNAPPAPVPA